MHELLFNSIEETNTDIRKKLYSSIILSGGNTLFPGLPSRLELELKKLYKGKFSESVRNRIVDGVAIIDNLNLNRQDLSFIGASDLSESFRNRNDFWTSKEDWEEKGSSIIFGRY